MSPALLFLLAAGACPVRAPLAGAPGLTAVAKLPTAEAMKENAEGKKLYRQERWAEARARYQAALAADPDFLDAQLNVACSLSRQGRYGEATDEAIKLIRAAYVPWQREVHEAADLGILQDQKDYPRLVAASAEAGAAWGEAASKGLFFVARTKPPVKVAGEGILVLRRNQEVFSWNPETGRYFQVTAEEGRVLGFVRSADRRRLAYLLGGKLVREHGRAETLRELSLKVLDLANMAPGPGVAIPGEVAKVGVVFPAEPELFVTRASGETTSYRLRGNILEEVPPVNRPVREGALVVSGEGANHGATSLNRPGCTLDIRTTEASGAWQIEIAGRGVAARIGKKVTLDARYGAGLPGLPFADPGSRSKKAHDDKK